jgi:hypothetical protein
VVAYQLRMVMTLSFLDAPNSSSLVLFGTQLFVTLLFELSTSLHSTRGREIQFRLLAVSLLTPHLDTTTQWIVIIKMEQIHEPVIEAIIDLPNYGVSWQLEKRNGQIRIRRIDTWHSCFVR